MSDVEQKTPNQKGASGAAWSDAEKIAYLIVLCENEGKVESKIAKAPIPAGRSVISCKKLLVRLKEKHKDDIEKIKAGQAFTAAADGSITPTPDKPKATPRKRKAKTDSKDTVDADGSAKKKAAPRKKKAVDVKEEHVEDEAMI